MSSGNWLLQMMWWGNYPAPLAHYDTAAYQSLLNIPACSDKVSLNIADTSNIIKSVSVQQAAWQSAGDLTRCYLHNFCLLTMVIWGVRGRKSSGQEIGEWDSHSHVFWEYSRTTTHPPHVLYHNLTCYQNILSTVAKVRVSIGNERVSTQLRL